MKVKIFTHSWDIDLHKFKAEINKFLSTLNHGVVKHVQTSMAATRTDETDQAQTEYIVTVRYEDN